MQLDDAWQDAVDNEDAEAYRRRAHQLYAAWQAARAAVRAAQQDRKAARSRASRRKLALIHVIQADVLTAAREDVLCFAKRIDVAAGDSEQAADQERAAGEAERLATARAEEALELLSRATTTFLSPLRSRATQRKQPQPQPQVEETMPDGGEVPQPSGKPKRRRKTQ